MMYQRPQAYHNLKAPTNNSDVPETTPDGITIREAQQKYSVETVRIAPNGQIFENMDFDPTQDTARAEIFKASSIVKFHIPHPSHSKMKTHSLKIIIAETEKGLQSAVLSINNTNGHVEDIYVQSDKDGGLSNVGLALAHREHSMFNKEGGLEFDPNLKVHTMNSKQDAWVNSVYVSLKDPPFSDKPVLTASATASSANGHIKALNTEHSLTDAKEPAAKNENTPLGSSKGREISRPSSLG